MFPDQVVSQMGVERDSPSWTLSVSEHSCWECKAMVAHSLPRPFVRVELVWTILRDEQAHVLLAIKRRLPWAQCSLATVQIYYMWKINLGSSTSLPWDFGERGTTKNSLILIVLVLWLRKSFVFDQWVLCLLPASMKY